MRNHVSCMDIIIYFVNFLDLGSVCHISQTFFKLLLEFSWCYGTHHWTVDPRPRPGLKGFLCESVVHVWSELQRGVALCSEFNLDCYGLQKGLYYIGTSNSFVQLIKGHGIILRNNKNITFVQCLFHSIFIFLMLFVWSYYFFSLNINWNVLPVSFLTPCLGYTLFFSSLPLYDNFSKRVISSLCVRHLFWVLIRAVWLPNYTFYTVSSRWSLMSVRSSVWFCLSLYLQLQTACFKHLLIIYWRNSCEYLW